MSTLCETREVVRVECIDERGKIVSREDFTLRQEYEREADGQTTALKDDHGLGLHMATHVAQFAYEQAVQGKSFEIRCAKTEDRGSDAAPQIRRQHEIDPPCIVAEEIGDRSMDRARAGLLA